MKPDLSKIPNNPGCYLYFDKRKKIIYVGKAKNLKKRVASYFNRELDDEKTRQLVKNIDDVDFIITNNEVEALILENNLIKKNKPKYNIDLKDSKRYAYIRLTKEEWPRLVIFRDKKEKGKYFGPFVSAKERDYILKLLVKTFKIRTCKRLPKKKCLRYDLELCDGPCIKGISKKDYMRNINNAVLVLKGKTSELVKSLKKRMNEESKKENFEFALELRNRINAVGLLHEKQVMERTKKFNENVINYIVRDSRVYLMLFKVRKGIMEQKEEFEFDFKKNFLEEFLVQYYSDNPIPKEIILPEEVDEAVKKFFRIKKVKLVIPKKGEKKKLLELVRKNIEIQHFSNFDTLEELQEKLNLSTLPRVIECFDVSHLGGTEVVASMVQFRNGKPDKNNYRKFKVKGDFGIDDTASIKEVVFRRYYRLVKENAEFPDLIVIDGGIAQLNFAKKSLEELKIKIPIISLAKREEEIYLPDGEVLRLNKKDKALLLLIRIRDEAHRFAVSFQRLRRTKRFLNKL